MYSNRISNDDHHFENLETVRIVRNTDEANKAAEDFKKFFEEKYHECNNSLKNLKFSFERNRSYEIYEKEVITRNEPTVISTTMCSTVDGIYSKY